MRNIKTLYNWEPEAVVKFCREYDFYGQGTVEEFSEMLLKVAVNKPTPEVLYDLATDILAHSRETALDVTCVMGLLDQKTVLRFYNIEEEGES